MSQISKSINLKSWIKMRLLAIIIGKDAVLWNIGHKDHKSNIFIDIQDKNILYVDYLENSDIEIIVRK